MIDTKAVKYTAISVGFDIEIPNTLCTYACLLHLDITVRALTFVHLFHLSL